MAKYKVLRDNYGFKFGYWTKDQIVDLEEHETPPLDHFERLDKNHVEAPAPSPIPEPTTFDQLNKARGKNQPNTGMAHKKEAKKS